MIFLDSSFLHAKFHQIMYLSNMQIFKSCKQNLICKVTLILYLANFIANFCQFYQLSFEHPIGLRFIEMYTDRWMNELSIKLSYQSEPLFKL